VLMPFCCSRSHRAEGCELYLVGDSYPNSLEFHFCSPEGFPFTCSVPGNELLKEIIEADISFSCVQSLKPQRP
jgi:hypothetical protein